MIRKRHRKCAGLGLAVLVWLAAGCALQSPRGGGKAGVDLESLLDPLNREASFPSSVKGIGDVKLQGADGLRLARMAWIVARGGRIRIEVLAPGGQSVLSLAADGEKITGRIHGQGRFFEHAASDPSLEAMVGFPIRAGDLVDLLLGRMPLMRFQSAETVPGDPGRITIALKRWWRTRQILTFDADTRQPQETSFYDTGGARIYSAVFERMQTIDGYRIPKILAVTGANGSSFRLTAARCWTDVAVSPETFVLSPPSPGGAGG